MAIRRLDRTILDIVEQSARNLKAFPLNLGGTGGGDGSPPGGFIGWLPQHRVSYDEVEAATLATNPSGVNPPSGWSLIDNLNHIRYRIQQLEVGSGVLIVDDGTTTVSPVTQITFVGGAIVTDLGGGQVQVEITASGGSGGVDNFLDLTDTPSSYAGQAGKSVVVNNTEDGLQFVNLSGVSEQILHYYNDDLTSQIPSEVFTTTNVYLSGTLRVYYNGIRQRKGVHYLDDSDFTTFSTYFPTYSGDSIVVDYDYLESSQTGGEFSLMDSMGVIITDSEGSELTESL